MNQGRPGGRFYLWGHRCHHGAAGLLAILAGALACWHDRHDFRRTWWLRDN
jgi:heme A synthase